MSPLVAGHVKEIDFDATEYRATTVAVDGQAFRNFMICMRFSTHCHSKLGFESSHDTIIQNFVAEFSHFPLFPNLKTLRIHFPINQDEYDFLDQIHNGDAEDQVPVSLNRRLQSEIFKECARLNLSRGFKVTSLELHNLFAFPNDGIHVDGFLESFMKPLKSLHVSLQGLRYTSDTAKVFQERFMKHDLPALLRAPAENLEMLTYAGDMNLYPGLHDEWDTLFYPRLRYLNLEEVLFHNIAVIEPRPKHYIRRFILRHRDTLEELTLSSCACLVDSYNNGYTATWEEIFSLFQKELHNLLFFEIYPPPGEDVNSTRSYDGYVYEDTELGYMNFFDEYPGDEDADREALERFLEMLKQRRDNQNDLRD